MDFKYRYNSISLYIPGPNHETRSPQDVCEYTKVKSTCTSALSDQVFVVVVVVVVNDFVVHSNAA